jgi:hypothetical protein
MPVVGKVHLCTQIWCRINDYRAGTKMDSKTGAISLALLIIALARVPGAAWATIEPQQNLALGSSIMSIVNQVPDFSVEGVGNGYSLRISSEGGYLSAGGSSIALTPWGYATSQWAGATLDIIFLANVTQSDFYIGFLYLTNSSSQIVLRTFEYQGGDFNTIIVEGSQRISNRMVNTKSVAMPKVRLDVKAQTENVLSTIGPEIYMIGNYGTVLNGSITLKVAAVRNQLFTGPNDYNELWALLADDFGNYYFAILYMQNSDPNHLTFEHQIRLNDLRTLPGRTLNAQWTRGHFPSSVTVRLPSPNSTVKVNGFLFQTNNYGVVSVEAARSWAIIEVPNEISPGNSVRLRFSSWDTYGSANPLNVTLRPHTELTAEYQTEYLLTIVSSYGRVSGAGWYLQGMNATFSISPLVSSNNGTRRVFLGFSRDYNSTASTGWVMMNSAKRINTGWKTEYVVMLQLSGVPANATAAVEVNGRLQVVNGTKATELWVDNNAQLDIEVQTTQIQGTAVNYDFKEIQVDGRAFASKITITKPTTVSIVFSGQQKPQSSINLEVTPISPISGHPVTISGSLPANSNPSTVQLSYSTDKVNWQPLASVTTGQGGSFSYIWTPNAPGSYVVEAYWQGDTQHAPSSGMIAVKVQNDLPANIGGSDGLPRLIQEFSNRTTRLPGVSFMLDLVRSLLVLGIVFATLLIPGAPPVVGYFVGSLFVGFVFVFPISAMVLAFRASRNRRSPSLVWLTPLVTIWIATLTLLIAGGIFFAIPQALLAASTILLVSSNALLVPLAFSLFVAKAIAS